MMQKKRLNRYRYFGTVLLGLFFLIFSAQLNAQITQNIRGQIIDADNQKPLPGASIILLNSTPQLGTVTDSSGYFSISSVPVGRYQMQLSFIGYETTIIPELLVESGKEVVLNIQLEEQATALDEVVVRASRNQQTTTAKLSNYTITVEETLRFPATFNDPARLAMAYPGVANDNDQNNNLVIRGNAPGNLAWRLEGVEIVNPNHLSNAGTFTDRPTQNGGGVNILSAQLLGTSSFLTGAFPANYGNALSGVMDMHFRKGNDLNKEYTAQASLLGLDLAAEGPVTKLGGTYLANVRYSTIGLLDALGVPLGDESINFYDLAFNLSFPVKEGGEFSIFGFGGKSKTVFEAVHDTAAWEFQKDRNDIQFDTEMAAMGLKYIRTINEQLSWNNVLIISGLKYDRSEVQLQSDFEDGNEETDLQKEIKYALLSSINFKINAKIKLRAGLDLSRTVFDFQSQFSQPSQTISLLRNGNGSGWLIQPFAIVDTRLSQRFSLQTGLHYFAFTLNNSVALEPRATLTYYLNPKHRLSMAYGLHSRQQLPQLYFELNKSGQRTNENIGFTRAHHMVLSYTWRPNERLNWRSEGYYQSLFDVPVNANDSTAFSALNLVEGYRQQQNELMNFGSGRNYGVETSIQHYLSDDYYFLVNASFYESKYTGSDGIERDTRFNGNYIFNLTFGKEWTWQKENKEKRFGANLRGVYLGGFRDTPIDVAASAANGETVYVQEKSFSSQQDPYFKTDLRFYLKNNKPGFSSTLSLDIQNATNAKNVAYSYFDTEKQEVVIKYQLGLIPILSYRFEF